MAKQLSRPKRVQAAADKIQQGLDDLRELAEEYQDWYDNMPEGLQNGATGDKTQEVAQLFNEQADEAENAVGKLNDLISTLTDTADDLENVVSEVEGADLPRGFGRD